MACSQHDQLTIPGAASDKADAHGGLVLWPEPTQLFTAHELNPVQSLGDGEHSH